MKKIIFIFVAIVILDNCAARAQDSTKINSLLNEVPYEVPSSPAFELLPNKPSEVTHLTTPKDLAANFSSFVDGGKLKSGAAVDIRPFAYAVGSLNEYQSKPLKQILWRSVFSLGTASESKTNSDIYIAAGLRIPIIDAGDPRANKKYLNDLEDAYNNATQANPPPLNETYDDYKTRSAKIAKAANLDSIRTAFTNTHWNAWRWDVGIGAAERAASGYLKTDSLFGDRVGIWTAVGIPLPSHIGQLTVSGNTAWINAPTDTSENNRNVIGARAQFFLTSWLSASGEYARIFSNYSNTQLDERWNHLAIVAEFKVPVLGGWCSLAYGGDSPHRTDSGTKFSFNYAIYTDRMIKKGQ
jgi:hypothetical protein